MADDKHYVPGSFYRISERSGFKIRADKTRKEWTGRIVGVKEWEARQPQDFVKGVRDDQTVPSPRPRSVDAFQGPLGTVLQQTAMPSHSPPYFIYLESTVRMLANDTLRVMMDNGEYCSLTVVNVPNTHQIQVASQVTYQATAGNVVIDVTAESDPLITLPGGGV